MFFFLDCCASGLAFKDKSPRKDAIMRALAGEGSCTVLTAGSGTQKVITVAEANGREVSLCTLEFLNALHKGEEQRPDGFLTSEEVYASLLTPVVAKSKQEGRPMKPRLWVLQPGSSVEEPGTFLFLNRDAKGGDTLHHDAVRSALKGGMASPMRARLEGVAVTSLRCSSQEVLNGVSLDPHGSGLVVGRHVYRDNKTQTYPAALRTTNEWQSCSAVQLPPLTHDNILQAALIRGPEWWITGMNGVILKSADRGKTWSHAPVTSKVSKSILRDIQFVGKTGWAVGGQAAKGSGVILKKAGGSASWDAVHSSELGLHALDFVNQGTGWVVGDAGCIYATTDGETWTRQVHSATDLTLSDVVFAGASRGWAVGASGVIVATADGGKSWTKQRQGTSGDWLFAVDFDSKGHGVAVGLQGLVLVTTNGDEWTPVDVKGDQNFRDVHITQPGTAWLVGDHGEILKLSW